MKEIKLNLMINFKFNLIFILFFNCFIFIFLSSWILRKWILNLCYCVLFLEMCYSYLFCLIWLVIFWFIFFSKFNWVELGFFCGFFLFLIILFLGVFLNCMILVCVEGFGRKKIEKNEEFKKCFRFLNFMLSITFCFVILCY